MRDFAYARARQLDDTFHPTGSAMLLAGGTELLNWLRLGIAEPEQVLDIGGLDTLRGVRRDGNAIVIGALTTLNEVGENPIVVSAAPALAQACLKAASAQIRNRATLGGNMLQKTRCSYFRAEEPLAWPCNKRVPGSGCSARHGHHERHAILGWTDACVAVQPSDPVVALACLDAVAEVADREGRRSIPMAEFHLTPEESDTLAETRLRPGELITGFRVPLSALARRSTYVKVRERESYEYAFVSAAAALELNSGIVREARVALGSVALKPWRLTAAEGALAGRPFSAERARQAVGAAMAAARPLGETDVKVSVATNAAVRALELAAEVA